MIGGVRTETRQGVVHYISFREKSLNVMCCLRGYSFVLSLQLLRLLQGGSSSNAGQFSGIVMQATVVG